MKTENKYNTIFEDFLALLNKKRVDYCITGAYAVAFHAEPRFTEDIDIYIAKTKDNSRKVAEALKEWAGESEDFNDNYFTENRVILKMGFPPNEIELINIMDGVKEKELMKNRVTGKYGSIKAYYIGLDDLIKNKGVIKNKHYREQKHKQDERDFYVLKKAKEIKKGKADE